MVKNITRNTIISGDFKLLKSLGNKSKGLIGKNKSETLIFTTRFGIHTFGLKFPIDVLVLNNEQKIVAVKENLKPNRVFIWNPKYNLVIELKNGAVKTSKTKINDYLEINL